MILCAVFTLSCSTRPEKGKTPAEVLYREGQALVKDTRYLMAIEKLNLLHSRYPYSFYATRAKLMLADIYFLQENYVQAASAYISFRDLHPKHKRVAYIIYRIAESFFQQVPSTHDRDLSSAQESIKYYREVVQTYSQSEYAKLARKRIILAQTMLNKKEKYIADFYFKTEAYSAAKYRYKQIIKEIKDQKIRIHAMKRVVESSYYLREYKKCTFYINKYFHKLNETSQQQLQKIKNNCLSKKY